jgi:hypothetical protein
VLPDDVHARVRSWSFCAPRGNDLRQRLVRAAEADDVDDVAAAGNYRRLVGRRLVDRRTVLVLKMPLRGTRQRRHCRRLLGGRLLRLSVRSSTRVRAPQACTECSVTVGLGVFLPWWRMEDGWHTFASIQDTKTSSPGAAIALGTWCRYFTLGTDTFNSFDSVETTASYASTRAFHSYVFLLVALLVARISIVDTRSPWSRS